MDHYCAICSLVYNDQQARGKSHVVIVKVQETVLEATCDSDVVRQIRELAKHPLAAGTAEKCLRCGWPKRVPLGKDSAGVEGHASCPCGPA